MHLDVIICSVRPSIFPFTYPSHQLIHCYTDVNVGHSRLTWLSKMSKFDCICHSTPQVDSSNVIALHRKCHFVLDLMLFPGIPYIKI